MAEWKKIRKFQSAKIFPDVDDLKDNPFIATVQSTFEQKYINDALRECASNSLWAFTNHLTQNYKKKRYSNLSLPKSTLKRVTIPYAIAEGVFNEYLQDNAISSEYKIINYWVDSFSFEEFMHDILKNQRIPLNTSAIYEYKDASQESGTVTIDGETFGFSGFTGNTYGATEGYVVELHYYRNTKYGEGAHRTETFTKSFATPYWNSTHNYLYVKYKTSPSDYWIACIDIDTDDSPIGNYIETSKGAQYLPLITLRSGYKAVDDPNCRMHKLHKDQKDVLRRVGSIDYTAIIDQINAREEGIDDDYKKSLENVISAHISFMADLQDRKSEIVSEYYYRYFYWLARTGLNQDGGVEHYTAGEYQYKLKWENISIYEEKTRLSNNARYQISKDTTYGFNAMTGPKILDNYLIIKHQIQADTVRVIKVKNPTVSHMVEYGWIPFNIMNEWDNDEGRFLIPIQNQILRKMGYVRGTVLLQYSMLVIFQVYKAIKKKWYQSTWFAVVRVIITIVILYFTGGNPIVGWMAFTANAALNLVIWILIMLSIQISMKVACKIFNVPEYIANIVNTVATIVMSFYNPVMASMNQMASSSMNMVTAIRTGNNEMFLESVIGFMGSVSALGAPSNIATGLQIANQTVFNSSLYSAIDNKDWVSLGLIVYNTIGTVSKMGNSKSPSEGLKNADNSVLKAAEPSSTNEASAALKQAKNEDLWANVMKKVLVDSIPTISHDILNSRFSQQTQAMNKFTANNTQELKDLINATKKLEEQIDEYCTGAQYVTRHLSFNKDFTPDLITRFIDANLLFIDVLLARQHKYAENTVRVQHGTQLVKNYQLFSPRVGVLT